MKKKHSKQKKHSVIVKHNDIYNTMSDYTFHITKDVRGGIDKPWDQRVNMKYGHNSGWAPHVVGETAATLRDNGDGMKISVGGVKIALDYSELEQLLALLIFHNEVSELNDTAIFNFYTATQTRKHK